MEKKLYICNFYRPPTPHPRYTPNEQMDCFFENFNLLLTELSSMGNDVYIFSDSNINLLNLQQGSRAAALLETALEHGFFQTNKKVTRFGNHGPSLIDHVFTNAVNVEVKTGTIIVDISDHLISFIQLEGTRPKAANETVYKRNFSYNNMSQFRDSLRNLSWINVTTCNDVDVAYNNFWGDFKMLFDLYFPLKKQKFNKNLHKKNKFMTLGLLTSRLRKNELLKLNLKNRTPESRLLYCNYRNLYNRILRASKKLYYQDHIKANKKNPKKLWGLLKEVSTGKEQHSKIEKISENGQSITDPTAIANKFNDFFSSVGTKISESVVPTEKEACDYLEENPNIPEMELGGTGPIQVSEIINSFESKNSSDLEGINTKLLKFVSIEISVPLAHIFNLSLSSGTFPSKLKQSRIVPIFKAGDQESCDNYRPISLLSSLSKILEKIVQIKLVYHLERNKLLYKHQYGFLKGKCTEHNLLHVTNKISQALNDGKYCIGLFLDLKKAFDVCSHDILLKKLEKAFGIKGTTLLWFKNYLSNRTQVVDINGKLSYSCNINISVLQGSILGPILFLCYINDLPNVTNLNMFLFADDASGLKESKNLPELIDLCNIEIQKLSNWFRANKMAVNISKTKFIIFHTKGKRINLNGKTLVFNNNEIGKPEDPNLVTPLERICNSNDIASNRAYKLLGVYFDENLSFGYHVQHICNKLSRSLFYLNRAKHFVDKKSLKMLYYSLVHSNLLYCIGTTSVMNLTNFKKIKTLQKKAIRIVTNAAYNANTSPLFYELKVLPYELLLKQFICRFMHAIEYSYNHETFYDYWPLNNQRIINYELRNNSMRTVPRLNYEQLKNCPLVNFPKVWNELAVELRLQRNPITFHLELLNSLFEELIA
jgi:Reverse transcriptase (RNA-dependent DNA polymerase)